ncbi:MAG: hypothetical protein FWE38_02395 [Firmicutes bacterium]|nr:hypothetical protein [Bacillota bacterium]
MAKLVSVGRKSNCESYMSDELKHNLIIENGNLFEISEELVARNLRNVPLACRARICLYNREGSCWANGISVIDDDDAQCATFIER